MARRTAACVAVYAIAAVATAGTVWRVVHGILGGARGIVAARPGLRRWPS
jgi:hypothetical protein